MIPYTVFACEFLQDNKVLEEIRALDMAEDHFTFRLADARPGFPEEMTARLSFYQPERKEYRSLELTRFTVQAFQKESYYTLFRFESDDSLYQECSRKLLREYTRYIRLKLTEDDAVISEKLAGYDVDEETFAEDFRSQKEYWFGKNSESENRTAERTEKEFEYGIALDRADLYEAYLNVPFGQFLRDYFEKNRITTRPVRSLYVGNAFCPFLYPEPQQMRQILVKAEKEKVTVYPVFSPMSESTIPAMRERLSMLEEFSRVRGRLMEIIVNDEGMSAMVCADVRALTRGAGETGFGHLKAVPGILLHKKLRDVRLRWERPADRSLMACLDRIPTGVGGEDGTNGDAVLYPCFQMNTAIWCTLYAAVKNGDRGAKEPAAACPQFCMDNVFLYPKDLHMVGIGNTIYGVVTKTLPEAEELLRKENVKRIIFNYQ